MEINKPVTALILFVITGILLFLFVIPAYGELQAAKNTLANKEAEFNGESDYYAKIADLAKGINDRKDALAKVDQALPVNGSIAPLIYFFQQRGTESGLLIKSITFSNANTITPALIGGQAAKKSVKDIIFQLDLTGNYQGLKTFLGILEKSARLFEVDTIALAPLQSLQNVAQVQNYDIKLQVKTHTY